MRLLDIHSHTQQSSENVIVIKNQFPLETIGEGFFSVGIHPWYFSPEDWQKQFQMVENKSTNPNCLAIGECGLDRNIKTSFDLQQAVFEQHILLSEEVKKPLIIHCVKAFSEVISLKKKIKPQQTWILHGFNKNQNIADLLLKNDIKISFGKSLLFSTQIQNIFKNTPQGEYFFESDDAEICVSQIYQKAQQLKSVSICNILNN